MRTILIYRNVFRSFIFVIGFIAPLHAQTGDSVAVARRVAAAAALAVKEYALGVPPAGGVVTDSEEVKEGRLFIDQARAALPGLPAAARGHSDSALLVIRALFDRTAAPAQITPVAQALAQRLAQDLGAEIEPVAPQGEGAALARGAAVFQSACASCHGASGRGDGPAARGIVPPPANLTDAAVMGAKSRVDLYRQLLLGVAGTAMPAFERTLADSDRWAVAAYVQTLQYGGSREAAVFAAVRRQLDSAVTTRSGDVAFDAYMTFEGVESAVQARQPALASRIENEFRELRERAASGDVTAVHRQLLGDLENAERAVTDKSSTANLFVQSFLLLVREGFEAILIIAALMTFLTKAGAAERRGEVAWGAWAGVAASVVTAILFELLIETTPGQRDALEGITMLVAVVVLFFVSYWLLSKVEADRWTAFLKQRVHAALSSGSALALASVAFLAVYREGVETILFYKALLVSGGSGDAGPVVLGVVLGAVALVALYVGIMRLGMRIPMKLFFAVTGALLYYMAFVFAGKGIAELQEGRVIGTTVVPALEWLRVPFLGVYPTLQSLALQGLLVALAIAAALVMRFKPSAVSHQPSA
ncbi:MAG TPA: cytochrome c/FTR1 family iron permease [Gemmatimonadales bacterium]|nr:cytochrome c/FTR1 family iron permease [Gemmatimonadales bacterium]